MVSTNRPFVMLQNHRRWSNVLYLPPLISGYLPLSTSIFLYLLNKRNLNKLLLPNIPALSSQIVQVLTFYHGDVSVIYN